MIQERYSPERGARNPARSQRDCGRQIEVNPYIAKTGTLAERPVSRQLLRSHGCSSSCHRPDALPTTLPRPKCAGTTRGGANLVVNRWLDAGTRRDPSRGTEEPGCSCHTTLHHLRSQPSPRHLQRARRHQPSKSRPKHRLILGRLLLARAALPQARPSPPLCPPSLSAAY